MSPPIWRRFWRRSQRPPAVDRSSKRHFWPSVRTVYEPGVSPEPIRLTQYALSGGCGAKLALGELDDPRAKLLINEKSGRAAVQIPTTSIMLDDGDIKVGDIPPADIMTE